MNLIVDIGNTRTKVAVVNKNMIIETFIFDEFNEKEFNNVLDKHPNIEKAIVSSTKHKVNAWVEMLNKRIGYVLELDHLTPLPIQNLYETPETLGKDRLAAAVGANHLFPNQGVLVIDAGTAITYDFVNDKNQYQGGFITPGLNMRFQALNHFTDKLPYLNLSEPQNKIGVNTNLSIKGGVSLGLEGEIERIIKFFSHSQDQLKIILTGGDIKYFEKLLKNYKFVALEIVVIGLNTILESNYIQKFD